MKLLNLSTNLSYLDMKVTLHPRDIPEEIAKAVVVESVGLHGMDTRAIVS